MFAVNTELIKQPIFWGP